MEKDGTYGLVNGARLVVLWLKMHMKGRNMKFIHLSDLHIGKRVNGFSVLEDQKYILDQILMIAGEEMPDGVLIAGDVYDKPVPPAEAVQVFDAFLTGLADRNLPVFVISGNHDSPERLAFGGQLTGAFIWRLCMTVMWSRFIWRTGTEACGSICCPL